MLGPVRNVSAGRFQGAFFSSADPDRRRALAWSATGHRFLIVVEAAFFETNGAAPERRLQTVLSMWAGVTCLATARTREQRRFWGVLGAGVLAWSTGQAMWTATSAGLFANRRIQPWDYLFSRPR